MKSMLVYILAIITAAFLQIGTVYLLRCNFIKNFVLTIPLILIYQFLFLWSYSNAPKFTIIWFVTAALTSILAFGIGYFVWKEQVSGWNLAGIVFVLVGMALLRIK